jgi:ABC-type Fe3+ transport system permease subunit
MKRIQKLILASFIALFGLVAVVPASTVSAIDVFDNACKDSKSKVCGAEKTDELPKLMQNIVSTLLFVLGIIAVIMIVIGGIRYATSGGDSSQIQAAKNTILYSVVGLVVAIMSYAIVNFVLARFQ